MMKVMIEGEEFFVVVEIVLKGLEMVLFVELMIFDKDGYG